MQETDPIALNMILSENAWSAAIISKMIISHSYLKHPQKLTKSTKWLRQKWHGHLGSEMSIASTVWLPSGSIWPGNSTI